MGSQETLEKKEDRLRRWKWRIFFGVFSSVFAINMSRRSLAFAAPSLMEQLQLSKSDIGILGSFFSFSFSVSKFFGGVAADYWNPVHLICISLMISGLCNTFFGMSSYLYLFLFFWTVNGLCQGASWPPVAKLLSAWYNESERATWWSATSSAQTVGGALISFAGSAISEYYGWRGTMLLPGILCLGLSFVLLQTLRESPEKEGVAIVPKTKRGEDKKKDKDKNKDKSSNKENSSSAGGKEKENNNTGGGGKEKESAGAGKESTSGSSGTTGTENIDRLVSEHVMKNPNFWLLCYTAIFLYVVRSGIMDWGVVMLMETKGFSKLSAGACLFWFEAAGVLGGLAAAYLSDRVYRGDRVPVMIWFAVGLTIMATVMWSVSTANYFVNCAVMFLGGFFLHGPHTMIGVTVAEYVHKKTTGTALGINGGFAGFGSLFAGWPLSFIIQNYGWHIWGYIISSCCIFSVLCLLPLRGYKKLPEK